MAVPEEAPGLELTDLPDGWSLADGSLSPTSFTVRRLSIEEAEGAMDVDPSYEVRAAAGSLVSPVRGQRLRLLAYRLTDVDASYVETRRTNAMRDGRERTSSDGSATIVVGAERASRVDRRFVADLMRKEGGPLAAQDAFRILDGLRLRAHDG